MSYNQGGEHNRKQEATFKSLFAQTITQKLVKKGTHKHEVKQINGLPKPNERTRNARHECVAMWQIQIDGWNNNKPTNYRD